MFLLNSCLSLFSAAISRWHPFSRSYGVILPSSLTMLLPPALGFSPHPPVSVYGTGDGYTIAAFPGSASGCFPTYISVHVTDQASGSGFSICPPLLLVRVSSFRAHPSALRPRSSDIRQCRNLCLLSIGYVFRPRLRSRLPQSRSALLWKPWIFGR